MLPYTVQYLHFRILDPLSCCLSLENLQHEGNSICFQLDDVWDLWFCQRCIRVTPKVDFWLETIRKCLEVLQSEVFWYSMWMCLYISYQKTSRNSRRFAVPSMSHRTGPGNRATGQTASWAGHSRRRVWMISPGARRNEGIPLSSECIKLTTLKLAAKLGAVPEQIDIFWGRLWSGPVVLLHPWQHFRCPDRVYQRLLAQSLACGPHLSGDHAQVHGCQILIVHVDHIDHIYSPYIQSIYTVQYIVYRVHICSSYIYIFHIYIYSPHIYIVHKYSP